MRHNLNFLTKMTILHITDLHLDHFEGDQEFLRKGFYREYIDRLYESVEAKALSLKIDYLIITGDFINKGKVENYADVETIIEYIAIKFNVAKTGICFTIGNHDYKWKEIATETELKLKEPFVNFRNKYISTYITDSENYFFTKLKEDVFFLSIDSTWNSKDGNPGVFSTSDEDSLIETLKEHINEKTTLLIGCHFPIVEFDNSFLAMEETNWHEKHLWIKGNTIRDRIKRLKTSNTIWFHGDVHASDQKIIENEIFVQTSKFGGPKDTSQQRRQAVVICIDEAIISKITCNYVFPTHSQHQNLGDWESSDLQELRVINPIQELKTIQENNLSAYNQEVEKEILRLIKEKELYKFGRFHISDEYISLGWVDINKLLSDKGLLNRISDKCFELIKANLSSHNTNETLFLGIEMIGGILASQLSVRFNIKNSVIPLRSKLNHYSEFESNHSSSFKNISEIKDIFIFLDLISSGNTITNFVEEISTVNPNINIHIISIISNDIENKIEFIPKTKSYTTFCTKLKIPLIKHNEMPEESFVKADLKIQ